MNLAIHHDASANTGSQNDHCSIPASPQISFPDFRQSSRLSVIFQLHRNQPPGPSLNLFSEQTGYIGIPVVGQRAWRNHIAGICIHITGN